MSLATVDTSQIDQTAILRAVNLDPSNPRTQALVLICQRYGLDPLLKHVVLISGNPYITRDGLLTWAHQSGQFDGIEIVDEGEDATHWWAKASVWRKDMTRPFTYRGRYPKSGSQQKYGPEMAIKCAEVMALRRAFNVTGLPAADERWDTPEPMLSVGVATNRLLEAAGGDREAARAAWFKAGLGGRVEVTEAELATAEAELEDLAWSWAPNEGAGAADASKPADEAAVDTAPEPEPDPALPAEGEAMTAAQSRAVHALLREKFGATGDGRFPPITQLVGREITSTKQLTKTDAGHLIDAMQALPNTEEATS